MSDQTDQIELKQGIETGSARLEEREVASDYAGVQTSSAGDQSGLYLCNVQGNGGTISGTLVVNAASGFDEYGAFTGTTGGGDSVSFTVQQPWEEGAPDMSQPYRPTPRNRQLGRHGPAVAARQLALFRLPVSASYRLVTIF
jgi:hypothetical protein